MGGPEHPQGTRKLFGYNYYTVHRDYPPDGGKWRREAAWKRTHTCKADG